MYEKKNKIIFKHMYNVCRYTKTDFNVKYSIDETTKYLEKIFCMYFLLYTQALHL